MFVIVLTVAGQDEEVRRTRSLFVLFRAIVYRMLMTLMISNVPFEFFESFPLLCTFALFLMMMGVIVVPEFLLKAYIDKTSGGNDERLMLLPEQSFSAYNNNESGGNDAVGGETTGEAGHGKGGKESYDSNKAGSVKDEVDASDDAGNGKDGTGNVKDDVDASDESNEGIFRFANEEEKKDDKIIDASNKNKDGIDPIGNDDEKKDEKISDASDESKDGDISVGEDKDGFGDDETDGTDKDAIGKENNQDNAMTKGKLTKTSTESTIEIEEDETGHGDAETIIGKDVSNKVKVE